MQIISLTALSCPTVTLKEQRAYKGVLVRHYAVLDAVQKCLGKVYWRLLWIAFLSVFDGGSHAMLKMRNGFISLRLFNVPHCITLISNSG